MSDALLVTNLVARAGNGDQQAWDALVDRYAPLVWSICCRHGLDEADARDVGQAVWLQLESQLGDVRDPAALARWLADTTWRECGKVRCVAPGSTAEQELLAAERDAVLREAVSRLPGRCQDLIAMLTQDPPVPPTQISVTLGIPVDRIELSRGRCLDTLRRDPAVAALISPGVIATGGEAPGQSAAM